MELKFEDSAVKNGKKLVKINEGDVTALVKRWENAVVAYFLSPFRQPEIASEFLNDLIKSSEWRNYGNVEVYSKGLGICVLDFETPQGKELALSEGPMFYDGNIPMILKAWSPDLSMEIKDVKSIPIWIKLPNLKLHLRSPEVLSRIGSLVGRPLFADTMEESKKTLSEVRICIQVDYDKVLPDSVEIEDDKLGCIYNQRIEYEWIPTSRCSHCGYLGHTDSCPTLKCKLRKRFCIFQSKLQIIIKTLNEDPRNRAPRKRVHF